MKILVTGGAGYIGSHTCNLLLTKGAHVTAIDNLSTGFKESLSGKVHFVQHDILDTSFVKELIQQEKFDSVMHFAAKLNVKESMSHPLEYYKNNVDGMISLLQASQNSTIKNFVFSSTAAAYGMPKENTPIDELSPTAPISPYGRSKIYAEQILKDFCNLSGMKYMILRYFNVAGASDDLKNGQRTADAYHLIHLVSQAATGKRAQVEIFGEDYNTADGTCERDYIHVEDLAELHYLALKKLNEGGSSETFNCGYGVGYSVKQIINCALKIAPVKFQVKSSPRRAGDTNFLVANSNKIQRLLNWEPQRRNIEKICQSAIDWEKTL